MATPTTWTESTLLGRPATPSELRTLARRWHVADEQVVREVERLIREERIEFSDGKYAIRRCVW